MPTFVDGQVNLAGLTNPGVFIDIMPPTPFVAGVPTNIAGIVGVAQWGPVGAPVAFSTPNDCAGIFGVPVDRASGPGGFDLPTHVWAASLVGGNIAFRGVRVTDGTDVAATVTIQGLTLTSKYTGSLANTTAISIAAGTAPNSSCIIISFPNAVPERFNNILGSGNAFWVNAANAINNGTQQRGPSNYVIATAGSSTSAPVFTGTSPGLMSGGTDGASGVGTAQMLGQDTVPRKGMYALRKSGCDTFELADVVDTSSWAAQDSFALSENMYAMLTTPPGDTIANAVATRTSAGIDDFPSKIIVGDWPTFFDTQNGYSRLVSPQAFAIGLYGNLSPERSGLNQEIRGISATQRTQQNQIYSDAEIEVAETGGVDLIVPPANAPGGQYFTLITGRNTSSNTAGNGDEYTRMTFFLARSLQSSAAGKFVGAKQSIKPNDPTRTKATDFLNGFLQNLATLELIDDFAVQCDLNNNPPQLQAQGFLFAYCAIRYLNIVRYFVIQLAGGGNVNVSTQANANGLKGATASLSQFGLAA